MPSAHTQTHTTGHNGKEVYMLPQVTHEPISIGNIQCNMGNLLELL